MRASRPPPFAIFPGNESLSPLSSSTRVASQLSFSYFGPLDATTLAKDAATFIASNVEPHQTSSTAIEDAILRLITRAEVDCRNLALPADKDVITNACWLTVRMWQPMEDYKTPRWHRDGRMFACSCLGKDSSRDPDEMSDEDTPTGSIPHSKYATVLLGPPTRILRPSERVPTMQALRQRSREELAAELEGFDEEDVSGAGPGAVVRFSWGEEDSPVHSEPDSSGLHRIFVSILFGNEDEIKAMAQYRQEKYAGIRVMPSSETAA